MNRHSVLHTLAGIAYKCCHENTGQAVWLAARYSTAQYIQFSLERKRYQIQYLRFYFGLVFGYSVWCTCDVVFGTSP